MDLYQIFSYVGDYVVISLLPISIVSIVFLVRFGWNLYRIPLFLVGSLAFEIGNVIFGKLYGYNLFLAPLFSLFNYYIWSRFFTRKHSKQRKQLIWTDIMVVFFATLDFYHLYTDKHFLIVPSYSLISLCIVFVLIYNYVTAYNKEAEINWSIFAVVFVYALFDSFFGLFLEFFTYWENDVKFTVWISHTVLLHLFYLFLPYYQWKIGKNPQHSLFG